MTCLYRYTFEPLLNEWTIEVPRNAQLVKVMISKDRPSIYFIVNPKNKTETLTFITIGTGEDFPIKENYKYIDSITVNKIPFHLFQLTVG